MTPPPDLGAILAEQIARVDRRVSLSPAYGDDARYVRLAARQVEALVTRLGLRRLRRNLTPSTAKPQFLLEFDDRSRVVLKVYGKQRRGEGAIQRVWWRAGVRCVRVLDGGDDPATWLLLESIPGPGAVDATTDPVPLTKAVASVMSAAHDPAFSIDGAVDLGDGVGRHLENAVAALAGHGYAVAVDWRRWMAAYGDGRRVHLHGDLFSGNVAFDARDGGLRVIDSCAYLGPPEFDAARWCARVGRAGAVQRLAEGWAEVERLDGPLLQRLLGLELLMEAGVRELVKIENGLPWDARDAETVALLAAATATGS